MNNLAYNPQEVNTPLEIDYSAYGGGLNRAERTPGAVAVSGSRQWDSAGGKLPAETPKINSLEPTTKDNPTNYPCGTLAIFTECETGQHHFAKKILCGKEWCPECGADDSQAHNRRIARWLPKFQQISQLGYFVIEFPDEYRKLYSYGYSKRALQGVSDRIIKVLAGKRTGRRGRVGGYFNRGLGRWHWFGDKVPGKWNPHFNVAVDGAYIEGERLVEIKRSLREAVNCPDLIIHYSYFEQPGEIYHKLKYISRATFHNYDWSPYMAEQLYGFRNCRWWGSWKNEPAWTLNKAIEAEADSLKGAGDLGSGICPDCGAPLKKWSKPVDSAFLVIWGAEEIGNTGYYKIPKREWTRGELSPSARYRLDKLEAEHKARMDIDSVLDGLLSRFGR